MNHLEVLSSVAEVEVLPAETGESGQPDVAHFLAEAGSLRGVDFLHDVLVGEVPDGEAETARRDVDLLKGFLAHASTVCVDGLFDDIRLLEDAFRAGDALAWQRTRIIARLPRRFGEHYTASFGRKFLIALVEVTTGLADGWRGLPTLAHALALHVLLEEAFLAAQLHGVVLPGHWEGILRGVLFEDRDIEPLYAAELDTREARGAAPVSIGSWFTPFDPDHLPSPYVRA